MKVEDNKMRNKLDIFSNLKNGLFWTWRTAWRASWCIVSGSCKAFSNRAC